MEKPVNSGEDGIEVFARKEHVAPKDHTMCNIITFHILKMAPRKWKDIAFAREAVCFHGLSNVGQGLDAVRTVRNTDMLRSQTRRQQRR